MHIFWHDFCAEIGAAPKARPPRDADRRRNTFKPKLQWRDSDNATVRLDVQTGFRGLQNAYKTQHSPQNRDRRPQTPETKVTNSPSGRAPQFLRRNLSRPIRR